MKRRTPDIPTRVGDNSWNETGKNKTGNVGYV
jgi:hypothetical protein